MKMTEKKEIIDKIVDIAGLQKGTVTQIYGFLFTLDTFKLGLIYEYLRDAPKETQHKLLLKLMKVCFNTSDKKLYPEELRDLFGFCLGDCFTKNTKEMNVSETNGIDISGCQCFTCKHKDDKKSLEGYYTGAYEAYKEAIKLVREAFPVYDVNDFKQINSLIAKLEYEKQCSGALLEEVELKSKEK